VFFIMNPWGVSFRPATLPLAVSCALAGASSLAWAQADVTTVAQLNAVNLPDTVVTATRWRSR
jgi:ABC-type cobalamin transport system permease subunit